MATVVNGMLFEDLPGRFQQGREAGQRNRMAQMAISDRESALDRQGQVNAMLGQVGDVAPAEQRNYLAGMASQGPEGMDMAQRVQGMWGNMDDRQRAQMQQKLQQNARMLAGVKDQQSYSAVRSYAIQTNPQLAEEMPEQYDPNVVQSFVNRFREIENILGGQGGGGAFAGTGIENQMLNIALDQSIPDTDPRKVLARQRLERETTTVTPEGTYVRPGYDLSAIGGRSQAQPQRRAQQPTGTQATPAGQLPGRGRLVEKPATEGERTSATYYGRMVGAQGEIDRLSSEKPNFNPAGLMEKGLAISNLTATPEYQQYRQAADDWIRAKLRKESGAAIPPDEMEQEYRVYFPMPGDSGAVIEQKRRARQRAERAMRTSAGRAVNESGPGSSESGGNVVNWSDL